jgi:hypothetical protein
MFSGFPDHRRVCVYADHAAGCTDDLDEVGTDLAETAAHAEDRPSRCDTHQRIPLASHFGRTSSHRF